MPMVLFCVFNEKLLLLQHFGEQSMSFKSFQIHRYLMTWLGDNTLLALINTSGPVRWLELRPNLNGLQFNYKHSKSPFVSHLWTCITIQPSPIIDVFTIVIMICRNIRTTSSSNQLIRATLPINGPTKLDPCKLWINRVSIALSPLMHTWKHIGNPSPDVVITMNLGDIRWTFIPTQPTIHQKQGRDWWCYILFLRCSTFMTLATIGLWHICM